MKPLFLCVVVVALTVAVAKPTKDAVSKRTLADIFNKLQEIVDKFIDISVLDTQVVTETNLVSLEHKLQLLIDVLDSAKAAAKKDNLIDKTAAIQEMLDKFVASVVNGTPLPPELVALGADSDPQTFITKVIMMAASNLGKRRSLMSVSRVI